MKWSETSTLDEVIVRLIQRKLTHTEDFKALLRFYGRPRIQEIWEKHTAAEREKKLLKGKGEES